MFKSLYTCSCFIQYTSLREDAHQTLLSVLDNIRSNGRHLRRKEWHYGIVLNLSHNTLQVLLFENIWSIRSSSRMRPVLSAKSGCPSLPSLKISGGHPLKKADLWQILYLKGTELFYVWLLFNLESCKNWSRSQKAPCIVIYAHRGL